tara:strand:+ start:97 stop:567 length:471 start_codon:yes stop_codon:yes gene_type:complete
MTSIYDYTAKDIYTLFSDLYEEKHGFVYKGPGFIGNEMHLIKVAIDKNGAASIACATLNCIKANSRTVNVPFFIAGLKYYLTPYNPSIYWATQRFGDKRIKKLWKQYLFLDATWLPKASQKLKTKELYNELKEWADAKTNYQKKRKVNTKSSPKAN